MKKYTREEQVAALKKLPKPTVAFLGSPTLMKIYDGIEQKLKLATEQGMGVALIANLTLMGLEDEHAVETNIHQLMPELSSVATRELAMDLQDRVFKEAARRVEKNIEDPNAIIPTPPAPEEEIRLEREAVLDAKKDDDPEILRLAAEDAKKEAELRAKQDAELEASEKEEANASQKVETTALGAKNAQVTDPQKALGTPPKTLDGIRSVSIAESKLRTPSAATLTESVAPKTLGGGAPQAPSVPRPQKPVDGIDPYRESIN